MNTGEIEKLMKMHDHLLVGLSKGYRRHGKYSIKLWLKYCALIGLTTWQDCTVGIAVDWFAWLRKRGLGNGTIRSIMVFPVRCIELLQQLEPLSVSREFVIPYAQLPISYREYRGKVLSEVRLVEMMALCIREIEGTKVLSRAALVPFLVLFCLRTGMNVESVLSLPRDCTVKNRAGHWIYWQKNRSSGSMRDHYAPKRWGAVEIIDALRSLHVGLLVFSYGRDIPLVGMHEEVRAWCRRNDIPEFTLSEIRPAMATLIYKESGGNTAEVQRFLHHSNLNTTILYLSENVIRPMNERALIKAQEAMLERWGIPAEELL